MPLDILVDTVKACKRDPRTEHLMRPMAHKDLQLLTGNQTATQKYLGGRTQAPALAGCHPTDMPKSVQFHANDFNSF